MSALLASLTAPVVQAPMGGGPSTPELAAAVSGAGGLGFLAAGYRSAADLAEDVAATRRLSDRFGVNVFVPGEPTATQEVAGYMAELEPEASRYGTEVGEPRFNDDEWEAKLELLGEDPVRVVSFTFGCPSTQVLERLKAAGSEVWVTVTTVAEAQTAAAAGADALVVQGHEAGAHQGGFRDAEAEETIGLLALLQLAGEAVELPLVASGGIVTGAGLAAVLAAGASAAQIGTAFLLCPEAGTSEPHREALRGAAPTRLTRAFTGRRARGIVNRFLSEHPNAPSAYPEIHFATAPIRAAARARGEADGISLWAGQAYPLAREEPAAAVVERLRRDSERALAAARERLG